METIKNSQTEKNILTAFCGESQARNRYTYFAKKAKKDGFCQIANVFEETANQEKEHAKRFFSLLEGGEVEITGTFPAGIVSTTLINLKTSAEGENYEHTTMYPEFAKIAKKEGFDAIFSIFIAISIAEKQHEKQYVELAANIESKTIFKKNVSIDWRCLNCGYVTHENEAPKQCPACSHPQAYFELLSKKW